jgi:twinkle protein
MAGRPIVKLAHSCGSRSGLQAFQREDGGIDGFCFSCGTYVAHPLGENVKIEDLDLPPPKTDQQIQEEIAEIHGYPCVDLPTKKLRAKHLEQFGIKIGLSERDGKTPETIFYPYRRNNKIVGYKVKLLPQDGQPKKIWSLGDLKHTPEGNLEPFGWQEALKHGGRRLIITEGEDDAVAYRSLVERHTKEEWKDHTPAIISLSHGAGNAAETLSKWKKEITARWKEVILVFDMDKAGEEAIQKAMLILPEATTVKLPSKDVNQCIIDGRGKAAYDAIQFHAEKPKNSRLVFGDDLHEVAKEEAKYGELSWPWEHLNKKTRGIRLGETIYIGAG